MQGPATAVAALAATMGCSSVLDLDDYATTPPSGQQASTGGAGGSSSTGGASTTSSTSSTGGAGGAGGCFEIEEGAMLVADTYITPNECDAANHWGLEPNLNVNDAVGWRALLRFSLSPDLQTAFASGTVTQLELKLTRNVDICGGCAAPGLLRAHPLRNQWTQGDMFATYDGADWCRRMSGQGSAQWDDEGAEGAGDIGVLSGEQPVDVVQNEVTLALNPSNHAAWAQSAEISIRLIGANGAEFLAYSMEGDLQHAPSLLVYYCP